MTKMATVDNTVSPNKPEDSFLSTGSSISSTSSGNVSVSALHDFITSKVKSKKETIRAKKIQKKWKKNKISKEDFCNKTVEFRMWLAEEKNIRLDDLPGLKSKEWFKKFVKKWNAKRLPQKYYIGADPYWAVASPNSYSRIDMPGTPDVEALDGSTVPLTSFTPVYNQNTFGTFGKKAGQRALKEVQTPVIPSGDHVYDEPLKRSEQPLSCNISNIDYENPDPNYIPPKARQLVELFSGPHPDMVNHQAKQLGGSRKLMMKGILERSFDELDADIPAAENSHHMLDVSASTPVKSSTEPLYAEMNKGRKQGTVSRTPGTFCKPSQRICMSVEESAAIVRPRKCTTSSNDTDCEYVPFKPPQTSRVCQPLSSDAAGEYITFVKPATTTLNSCNMDTPRPVDSGDYVTLTNKVCRKRPCDKSVEEEANVACKLFTTEPVYV